MVVVVGGGAYDDVVVVGRTPVGEVSVWGGVLFVLVTGQTVVEMAMVEVITVVECAGQLLTVGAQLVTVTSVVVKIVEVTKDGLGDVVGWVGTEADEVVGLTSGVV